LATRIAWAEAFDDLEAWFGSGCFAGALNLINGPQILGNGSRKSMHDLLKRLLDITVILLMERLARKGGNGLKVVTQAGFHRVGIPHESDAEWQPTAIILRITSIH